jgi:hypothetical protein
LHQLDTAQLEGLWCAGPVDWPVACFVQFAGSEQPGEQAALSTAKVKEACVGREQAAFQDFTEDVVGRQFAACIAIGEPVAILERAEASSSRALEKRWVMKWRRAA